MHFPLGLDGMAANPNGDKAGVSLALLSTGRLPGTLGTPATFKCVVAPWVCLSTERLERLEGGKGSCHTGPAAPPSASLALRLLVDRLPFP